jgi:tRNA(fMet)-specific endonuclease VapC
VPFLIDTDWVVDALHGRSDTIAKLKELESEGLSISIITLAEIYEGIFYSDDPIKAETGLNDFMRGVIVRKVDDAVARIFAHERDDYESCADHWPISTLSSERPPYVMISLF